MVSAVCAQKFPGGGRNPVTKDTTTASDPATEEPDATNPGVTNPGGINWPGFNIGGDDNSDAKDPEENAGGNVKPGNNAGANQAKKKVVRILPPWSNTTAIMYYRGEDGAIDTTLMKTIKNYCGWFEASIVPPESNFYVYFKQTIGLDYVSNIGKVSTPVEAENEILLDSIAAVADTIWINALNGIPTFTSSHPGVLGPCPTKKLSVMMIDWKHGDKKNDEDNEGINGDFGQQVECNYTQGMVESTLGPNGVPVRAANFPEKCASGADYIDYWFVPVVVANEGPGRVFTNSACRDVELTLQDDGLWLAQKDDRSAEGGFFLLDDFEFLDPEGTVPNPYYDNLPGNGGQHNFGFTMRVQAEFEYVPGQYFEFNGDDDVWVFINNKLVVDIGGTHTKEFGAVSLDTLGLKIGETYPFSIFYAERKVTQSNFMMRTSIDLRTEASITLQDVSLGGVFMYNVWQTVVTNGGTNCGILSSDAEKKTEAGPSIYTLTGGNLPAEGIILEGNASGTYYGGIKINNDMASFSIDTLAIKDARALAPGSYCLRIALQSDPSQVDEVWFIIGAYELPQLAYTDASGKVLGTSVDEGVYPIGEWSNQIYPVYITYVQDWADFDDIIYLNSSDTLLAIVDENGNPISSVSLVAGKGKFYVMGKGDVINATIMAKGEATANTATYVNVNLKIPPVPIIDFAIMSDRNGDGRGDSLYLHFDKTLNGESKLSKLSWQFNNVDKYFDTIPANDARIKQIDEYTIVVLAEGGFEGYIFTGGAKEVYAGKIHTWFTYQKSKDFDLVADIQDGVNPLIYTAVVELTKNGTELVLTFSEGLADSSRHVAADLFQYKCWRSGQLVSPKAANSVGIESKNTWRLLFANVSQTDVLPQVGDTIRFTPGVGNDLAGVVPHVNNPWVRITGEQNVIPDSPPLVIVDEKNITEETRQILNSDSATVPKLTEATDAKEAAAEFGVQGSLLPASLKNVVENEITNTITTVQADTAVMNLYQSNPTLLTTIVKEIEETGSSTTAKAMGVKISKDVTKAIKQGTISSKNISSFVQGNSNTILASYYTPDADGVKPIDNVKLYYKTTYYSHLGNFVNSNSNVLSCTDAIYGGDCFANDGNIYLAWNMRAEDGRLAATGVYIMRLEFKIKAGKRTIVDQTMDKIGGFRRGKLNANDLRKPIMR
ncbi:MAG: fibro-slime domain-containing protein [Fibrobacteraceae bacterium]|nr:fibro-slime domain-containing protein [Fibrobacteraceae bacterium]